MLNRPRLQWHCIKKGECSDQKCYLEKFHSNVVTDIFDLMGVNIQFIKATCCCCFKLVVEKDEQDNWICQYCETYDPKWHCKECNDCNIRIMKKQRRSLRKTIVNEWERKNADIPSDHHTEPEQKKVTFSELNEIHPVSPRIRRRRRNLNIVLSENINIPTYIQNLAYRSHIISQLRRHHYFN